MKTILLVFVVSVIVEAIIDYFEQVFDLIEDERIKKAAKQGTALVLALIFTFEIHVTMLAALLTDTFGIAINPIFDMLVTGLFSSRGANYASEIVRLIRNAATPKDDDSIFDMLNYIDDDEEEGDDDESSAEGNEE